MIQGGFFSKEEVNTRQTIKRLTGCGACGLNKTCISPKIPVIGRGEKGILIVSDIPCAEEDASGRLMQGIASDWLSKRLAGHGINMKRDCRKIAAVSCHTPKGRTPVSNEITMCRPTLLQEIKSFCPEIILVLGSVAIESFLGDRWLGKLGGINKWRGFVIPDRSTGAWVAPLFHPVHVQKSCTKKSKQYNPVVKVIFNQDLERALSFLEKPFPKSQDERELVELISDPQQLISEFDKIIKNESPTALDFECTGLKPQAIGHSIISCALSTGSRHSIAFLMPQQGPVAKRLRQLFESPVIPKRAHNIKFETNWASVRFRANIKNWEWDSMLAAHILDNRSGITGLKFQVYVSFGVIDYSSHLDEYLKTDSGNNTINRIKKAPVSELLLYNGLDSLFEYKLSEIQMSYIKKGVYP